MSQPQVPAGPLPMAADGQEEKSETALLGTWLQLSEVRPAAFGGISG